MEMFCVTEWIDLKPSTFPSAFLGMNSDRGMYIWYRAYEQPEIHTFHGILNSPN